MLDLNGIDVREWLVFDPSDVERLFAQDYALACGWTTGFTVPTGAQDVKALRNALRLPFTDEFLAFIHELIEVESARELEAPAMWRDTPSVVESRVTPR